jgi:Protein of unknown function (DUF3662)/FHA domain
MSVLRSINQRLEGMVEGVFGRTFKAQVQPVELAHKLAKEMSDHKLVSVARVYVPNEYEVYLSREDYDHLHSFEDSLRAELSNYLAAFAQREGWTLVSMPQVTLLHDEHLRLGEFGIATRTVDLAAAEAPAAEPGAPAGGPPPQAWDEAAPPDAALPPLPVPPAAVIEPPAPPPGLAQTVMYQPAAPAPPGGASAERPPVTPMRAYLRMQEQLFAIKEPVAVLGRSKRCDIVLPDPNVSRQHAEIRLEGDGHAVVDLDSTNGVKVNGREVKRAVLADGDRIELGSTELRFERRP